MSKQANLESAVSAAELRSWLLRELARGFQHPTLPFHQELLNGRFQTSLEQISLAYLGEMSGQICLPAVSASIEDFEAGYISLFQVGMRGCHAISLNAGDHEPMTDGRSRPDFMLDYTRWYRKFGLHVHQGTSMSELPDHLACQLEFLAWLASLETRSVDKNSLRLGYGHAQSDFLERLLLPFLNLLDQRLLGIDSNQGPFFKALLQLCLSIGMKSQLDCAEQAMTKPSVSTINTTWPSQTGICYETRND